MKKLIK